MGLENRARLVARCFQRLPSFGGVVGSPCLLFLRFAQRRGENGGPARPGALVQLWFTPGRMWRGGEDAPPDLPQPPRGLGLGRWPLSSSLVRRESGVVGPKVRGVGRRRGLRAGLGAARVPDALEPPAEDWGCTWVAGCASICREGFAPTRIAL